MTFFDKQVEFLHVLYNLNIFSKKLFSFLAAQEYKYVFLPTTAPPAIRDKNSDFLIILAKVQIFLPIQSTCEIRH